MQIQKRPVKNILTFFLTLALLAGLPDSVSALTSLWQTLALDKSGSVGRHSSLAVVNGYPAISYYDETTRSLKFIRAYDASGTSWGSPQTLDSGTHIGWYTSLAVVNGVPAISYYAAGDADLKFIRATDANGTSWKQSPNSAQQRKCRSVHLSGGCERIPGHQLS